MMQKISHEIYDFSGIIEELIIEPRKGNQELGKSPSDTSLLKRFNTLKSTPSMKLVCTLL